MQYNFILIRTDKGGRYARKILNSVKWLNENKYPQHEFVTDEFTIAEFLNEGMYQQENGRYILTGFSPSKTIIHARCANPRTQWTEKLRKLQESGYKVVNSVDCIELTSNKLACSLHLQGKVNHPKSWEWKRDMDLEESMNLIDEIEDNLPDHNTFIAKPYTSLEQGANVKKIVIDDKGYTELFEEIQSVPGNKIVIQEYIPYTALHRVIVIGGKALPYTFIDKPEWHPNDWKVSCCLNRTTMKLDNYPERALLELAEKTQKEVGGVINFIDIFEYEDRIPIRGDNRFNPNESVIRVYTNAEINTACSLNIHERLAKSAGRTDWNIHYRIAKQLVKELLGE